MKILINISGEDVELSLSEAGDLYRELDILFNWKEVKVIPATPYPERQEWFPYVTCNGPIGSIPASRYYGGLGPGKA